MWSIFILCGSIDCDSALGSQRETRSRCVSYPARWSQLAWGPVGHDQFIKRSIAVALQLRVAVRSGVAGCGVPAASPIEAILVLYIF